MTLVELQNARNAAMKAKDTVRKDALTAMIDAVQKASITSKGRIEITEQLTDEVLIKYQKTIQEMIDTCPTDRTDLMDKYVAEMVIVKEFAPQLMTNKGEIERTINDILNGEVPLTKANKGSIMKLITPHFKGKADMKIVSQVVAEMLV
jgi:uncharacterized protein YqeY